MRILPALCFLLLATPALAQSNIGLTDYPAPKCTRPPSLAGVKKPAVPNNPTPAQADTYNAEIRAYNIAAQGRNEAVKTFNACMQAYVAAGNADIRRIQDAVNGAVNAANAP
jgi:hypothetical protein